MVEATLNQLLRWVTDLNEGEAAPAPTVELFEEDQVATELAKRDEQIAELKATVDALVAKQSAGKVPLKA